MSKIDNFYLFVIAVAFVVFGLGITFSGIGLLSFDGYFSGTMAFMAFVALVILSVGYLIARKITAPSVIKSGLSKTPVAIAWFIVGAGILAIILWLSSFVLSCLTWGRAYGVAIPDCLFGDYSLKFLFWQP